MTPKLVIALARWNTQNMRTGIHMAQKQKITLCLRAETVRKVRILAAKRSMSVRSLLSEQIELLADRDEGYGQAKASALALMRRGFHLGGMLTGGRDELHRR